MTYDERQQALVKAAITKLGNQSDLARRLNVTRQLVSQWVRGDTKLTGAQVLKLQDLVRQFDSNALPERPQYTFERIRPLASLHPVLQKMADRLMQILGRLPGQAQRLDLGDQQLPRLVTLNPLVWTH